MKYQKIPAILICMLVAYAIGDMLGGAIKSHLLQKYIIPDSYISEIKTTSYDPTWVTDVLKEFNAMAAPKEAVLFEKHVIDRKIVVQEVLDLDMIPFFLRDPDAPVTIGYAVETEMKCTIQLKTGLDYATFRRTLIHEYLHCMGFDHVNDNNDLMGAVETESSQITEENIKGYAEKVAKKIWKNLKN